jgi:arabinogalactan oligomer / maltooligosaccharide transport system permease protein
MSATELPGGRPGRSGGSSTFARLGLRLIILALIDALAIWTVASLLQTGSTVFAIAVGLVTVFANIVILRDDAYPLRWMLLGLVLMLLFSVYPILYTVSISATNYGFGNLLTKEQAIAQIENPLRNSYVPEGGISFRWTAFRADSGEFLLWLQRADGTGLIARPGEPISAVGPGEQGVGELDDSGVPTTIEGYQRLNRLTVVRYLNEIDKIRFGAQEDAVVIRSLDEATQIEPLYQYDPEQDVIVNQENGKIYTPTDVGFFRSADGEQLSPGFRVNVGLDNFRQFFTSPQLRGPLVRIIIWNFAFAFLSVVMTFGLGLAVALLFNDPELPGRKIIFTLLLIPYTIPSLISIMVWRGLLNPEVGIINKTMEALIGFSPAWFTDQWWAKAAILLVNLWLGYPYYMLVCSGALQAIPNDIYSAAEVDGANIWQRFWRITLPLLLIAVGPLLVASFTFNFNNFNIIFLFIRGGPPIAGSLTQAGHTDILISYVYNLAFEGGRGAQYGLAAAITMVIFFVVAVITLLQFRYTRMWEQAGENV